MKHKGLKCLQESIGDYLWDFGWEKISQTAKKRKKKETTNPNKKGELNDIKELLLL